jgi:hypothetical protein
MLLVREILYCKPGKVRSMVQKSLVLARSAKKLGMGPMRVMTDFSAERFWTVVTEIEVESVEKMQEALKKSMEIPEIQEAMKDYHDLVDKGRREIYTLEG